MSTRFTVTYRIFADTLAQAGARAEAIALEQTVEIPRDLVPAGFISDEIIGRIEHLQAEPGGSFQAVLSFSAASIGGDLPQLLNVMFGNSSLQQGLRVLGFDLGEELRQRFQGATFGIRGLRKLVKRVRGGLIAPVIKPLGSSADTLAALAYRCALAGADIIKEDHGLANQPMAPFKERCEKIARAVVRANHETGGSALYFANLAGASEHVMAFARFAKAAGAGGLLVIPGLLGFDLMRRLSEDQSLALPIMAHPSLLGPHVLSPTTGFTHGTLFGSIMRLAGADISIFPNVGGRFGFTRDECLDITHCCRDTHGVGEPIFPSPGGGMSIERATEMRATYGDDVIYLLGGNLLRHQDHIGAAIQAMRSLLDSPNCAN